MDRVREWVLVVAAGVTVSCLLLLLGDGPARSAEETLRLLGTVAVWWALGAAVLVVGVGVARDAAGRRSAKRDMVLRELTSAAVPVVGRHPGGHTVRVLRWSKLEPQKLVVRYPREHDPEGVSGRLAAAVGQVTTGESSERGWDVKHERLRHRYVLTPKPAIEPEERERERAEQRVVRIVKAAIPGCKTVTIDEWGDDHRPAQITARFDPSPRLSSANLQAAVLRVISDGFPGRWRSQWDHEHDRVTFALRPEMSDNIPRPLNVPASARLQLRYGVDEDGNIQAHDLDGSAPHCLVVGPTGGGKTYALRALALDAISQGVVVNGLDPKRIELMGLIGVPGVEQIATSPQDMADLIYRMKALMDERYEQIERREVERKDLQPVLFLLDEFFILRMRLNQLWKAEGNKGNEHAALGLVWELLALARSARIHLVIGIQRPDAEFLAGSARDNLRHRIALGAMSSQGAQMMWESTEVGVDLPNIQGRAVATGANGVPHEIQVWVVPNPDPLLDGTRSAEEQALLDSLLAGAASTKDDVQLDVGDVPAQPAQPLAGEALVLVDGRYLLPEEAELDATPPARGEQPAQEQPAQEQPAQVVTREWDDVPAEQLMEGDVVRLEGAAVVLTSADFDPMDEECTLLEWEQGSVSLPGNEVVSRARDEDASEAA